MDLKQLHFKFFKDLNLVKMAQEYEELMLLEDHNHFKALPLPKRFKILSSSDSLPNLKVALARILAVKLNSGDVDRLIS